MMFEKLLEELDEKGIEISVVNGKLSYAGPEQYVNEDLLNKLKENKGKLIRHFWPLKNSNLIPLNTEGHKIPLILVHGERGNYYYKDFLDPDQTFYGFLHLGSDGESVKYRTAEEFAKEYIRQLLVVVPKGPIYLGGFSFGGIIAFEMANQLKQMGFEIIFLLLVDCVDPYYRRSILRKATFREKLCRYIWGKNYPSLKSKIRLLNAKANILVGRPVPVSQRNFYILSNYTRAYTKYYPEKYDGKVILFRSKENEFDDHTLGWDKIVSDEVEVIDFEGDHLSIMEESESARFFIKKILQKMTEVNNNSKG
jgi:thioesterase domain-containing protein